MNDFIFVTYSLMNKMAFTPLVLLGLLITSLSLILNLKDTNTYIRKFKEHKNIDIFINRIFYTSLFLLLIFIISIIAQYISTSEILTFVYLIFLFGIIWNLFIIVYTLKKLYKLH